MSERALWFIFGAGSAFFFVDCVRFFVRAYYRRRGVRYYDDPAPTNQGEGKP